MPTITIDGVEHELEDLSNDAKAQLNALQATDIRIAQTQQELAILQTARAAYAAALQRELPASDTEEDDDD
tara:strand:+ start:270 stop:482 length:213 start_codon:yes stop_codon:yes gene_type:complete